MDILLNNSPSRGRAVTGVSLGCISPVPQELCDRRFICALVYTVICRDGLQAP